MQRKMLPNIHPKLRRFLFRNNALHKFIENCHKRNNKQILSIESAFIWANTSKGYTYWEKLNRKYIRECLSHCF